MHTFNVLVTCAYRDEAKMRANAEAAQRKLDDFLKAKAAAAAKAVPAVEVEGEGEAEAEEAEKADEATEADDVCAYEPLCVTQDAHCEEAMGVDPTDDEEEMCVTLLPASAPRLPCVCPALTPR